MAAADRHSALTPSCARTRAGSQTRCCVERKGDDYGKDPGCFLGKIGEKGDGREREEGGRGREGSGCSSWKENSRRHEQAGFFYFQGDIGGGGCEKGALVAERECVCCAVGARGGGGGGLGRFFA